MNALHGTNDFGTPVRVRPAVLNGVPLLYVEAKARTGWIFIAQCRTHEEVAKHVPLASLK